MLKVFYLKITEMGIQAVLNDRTAVYVSEDTFRTAMSYRNAKSRFTRLTGELMINYLLRRYYHLNRTDFKIMRQEHGKPCLTGVENIYYNISHSGDYIVCALADTEVGIDIEKNAVARLAVARRFFHPQELGQLEKLEETGRNDLFFTYWSVKESFLKYTGSGLTRSLSSFYADVPEGFAIYEAGHRVPVVIRPCGIDPGYACYVCSTQDVVPDVMPLTVADLLS